MDTKNLGNVAKQLPAPCAPRRLSGYSANTRLRVNTLVSGANSEIEQLRSRMRQLLAEVSSLDASATWGAPDSCEQVEALEELVHSLRQANEHLVIASLDANAREMQATLAHERQTEFLSMLAHELRNPLAPIVTGVELMKKFSAEIPALWSLQGILKRQTDHLTRLVDDLLDATRISTGKVHLKTSAVLLAELVTQAVETSRPLLDAHHQPVRLNLPAESIWIHGDLVRLSQLLTNLIINASKFSEDRRPVDVTATREDASVLISVKDQGLGIAPERQPCVFDLFVQGPVAGGLRPSGLGVGLSLVRTIAQLHGGDVTVHSEGVGRGSEFTVSLPVMEDAAIDVTESSEICAGAGSAAPSPYKAQGKSILLIDDSQDINLTLSELLQDAGHHVDLALDGEAGLRMSSQATYDFICCDIGLPTISGYEVAQQLRQAHSSARLIAISGFSQPEHKARALQAGFSHYLQKPISGHDLLDLITDDEH